MTKLKIALLISTAAFGFAAAQAPAKVTASTFKVTQVTENGKTVEKLEDASKVGVYPNDTLLMTQKMDNLSTGKLAGVRLTMPIPPAVTLVSQQCDVAGVKAQYSVDAHQYDPKTKSIINVNAKKFGDAPLKKTVVVKENGVDVKKEVNATNADYTAIRWQLPDLAAKQSVECSIRVKVK